MIDTPIRTLSHLADAIDDLISSRGKHVYADDLRDVLVRVDRSNEAALLDALNCEPWHYVGMHDEEACFWCSIKRFGGATDDRAHEPECAWVRLSPHPAAVVLRKYLEG